MLAGACHLSWEQAGALVGIVVAKVVPHNAGRLIYSSDFTDYISKYRPTDKGSVSHSRDRLFYGVGKIHLSPHLKWEEVIDLLPYLHARIFRSRNLPYPDQSLR